MTKQKVSQDFQERYCSECSLKICCDGCFNPHCAKVMFEHEQALAEVKGIIEKALDHE